MKKDHLKDRPCCREKEINILKHFTSCRRNTKLSRSKRERDFFEELIKYEPIDDSIHL